MKHLIAATLEVLDRSGIPYCLLHGREQLGETATRDVDLAILPQDLGVIEEILFSLKDSHCVQLLQHESTGFYFVLAAVGGKTIRFLRLDLATDYRRNGRLFMNAAELISGRQLCDSIWVASPEVEFSYLLVKKVLKGNVSPFQLERLKLLSNQLGSSACATAARYFGIGQAEAILAWLGRRDWSSLEENLPSLRSSLRRLALRRDPLGWLRYWLPELRRIWRRWRYPTGLFVAILGPDGSGKSTLIRRLPADVGQAFRRSDAFHLRPGLLPATGSKGPVSDPHGEPPRSRLASIIKLLYLTLDYLLGYLFQVRPRLARSSLVLFDRYFYDIFADARRYRYSGPLWLLNLAGQLVPKPDLCLVLDVPEKELLERKQEVPLAEAERQRAAYRRLAAELPNALLLDGRRIEEKVELEAAEAMLSFLRWRYGRRRHLWFHASRAAAWDWLTGVLCPDARQTDSRPAPSRPRGQAYWQLSLADGRGFLFPLLPPRTAAAALQLYSAQRHNGRAAKSCLAAGLAAGLIQPLLPRPRRELGGARGEAFLLDRLEEVLGRRDLSFAISLGTPGPHRKPVVQVLEGSGRTLAYAKIGWDEATCELVSNEAEVLRGMEGKELQSLFMPTLLHLEPWRGRLVCLQSPPPPKARQAGRYLDLGYFEALQELAGLGFRRLRLAESMFWKSLSRWTERVMGGVPGSNLGALLEQVPHRLRDEELPFHLSHGDFVPWNALVVDGRPFLFDWEYAREQWLPGYDLFHFLFQTRLLLAKEPPARIFREVWEQVTCLEAIRAYWQRLGIQERNIGPLMLLYLLDRAVYHAYLNPGQYHTLQRILVLVELGCSELGWLS
jgi:thymidylate kinase